jgi:hypothetical protein
VLERVDPDLPLVGIPTYGTVDSDAGAEFWAEANAWSTAFLAPEAESGYQGLFEPLWADDAADVRSAGYAAGMAGLEEATKGGHAPVFDGWTVGLHFFDYNSYALGLGTIDEDRWKIADEKERILIRAVACRLGLWGNHAYEAVYAQAFTDIDGAPLTGDFTYEIVVPSPPPVGAFWSITLYDIPNYYLVDNTIDRYSIGDRTAGIQYGDDGSLTITIARNEPTDTVARANWLPAPDAAFRLVFRLYTPGETILNGTWSYPQVRKLTADTARV